jgi:uncharacterized protein (TIGR03437 family)
VKLRFFSYVLLALPFAIPAASQATLTPSPASLSFTWVVGAPLPAVQTISVKATGSTAAFTTAIAPLGTQWITITPSSVSLPTTLSVLVNPSGLPIGTNLVNIEFSATGFGSILSIPVMLTVEDPLPTLLLSSTSLSFSTPPDAPAAQTVTLTTTGGPIPFGATIPSAPWMTVTPLSGVVLPGFPVTLTFSVGDIGYAPSATAYSGKISIVATGVPSTNATQTIAVSMLVNALTPTITNLYPSAALVASGALTVTITGTGFYTGTVAVAGIAPTARKTTYVNSTTILAALLATDLASAGPMNILAQNPAPGGPSAPAVFTVSATPVVQAVVNAASYAVGAVAPGEFVTLFGTGIGPATPAEMTVVSGYATTTLNNVSVTIDGKSAPMIYVSANQITVQVPYTVTIATVRPVVVSNSGVISLGAVDTTNTAPGLFALAGNGLGQCAALRYAASNGAESVNSSTSAALVGDIIVFYLTGEGIYDLTNNPATGFIVPNPDPSPPQLSPLPSVIIGGQAAVVQYAGPVPGGLLGLLQINAVVPAGSTTGNAVPVAITIGTGVTQVGATIAVK